MPCICNNGKYDFIHGHDPGVIEKNSTRPIDPCLYCAEKHLATAAAMARESGYEKTNRGYVIGELIAACWHLHGLKEAESLSKKIRDFRHEIQSRHENYDCKKFDSLMEEIDMLINESIEKIQK